MTIGEQPDRIEAPAGIAGVTPIQESPVTHLDPTAYGEGLLNRDEFETEIKHGEVHTSAGKGYWVLERPVDPDLRKDPEGATVLVPGYMGIGPAYEASRKACAQLGMTTVSMAADRSLSLRDLMPHNFKHPEQLAQKVTWGVIKDVGRRFGIEGFNLNGHSWGGPNALSVADHHPNEVKSVTLTAPAGVDEHTWVQMYWRALNVLSKEVAPNAHKLAKQQEARFIFHMVRHIFSNLPRTAIEGHTAATCIIRDKASSVRQKNVPVGIIAFLNDGFFPVEGIRKVVDANPDMTDTYFEHPDPAANHIAPQLKAVEVADSYVHVADLLDKESPLTVLGKAA